MPQRCGHAVVEENEHSLSRGSALLGRFGIQAAGGEFQNGKL
jgi:hypothetical protein